MLVIVLALPLLALVNDEPPLPSAAISDPIVMPLPEIDGNAWRTRGQLVSQEPYKPPFDDHDAVLGNAWRAVYRSLSGVDGAVRDVSGAFFLPRGTPPPDGWPVISAAHGTTGIGNDCGPSRQPDLQGYAPLVQSLLSDGYAVALTDYEGLGAQGAHPYLEPRTAAFNTIDAVRALRRLTPLVSTRWVALGYSQGGQAVWAANELDDFYGHDLQLMGSVALAPSANATPAADLAWNGSLTEQQRALLPLFVISLARYNPGLDTRAFLHGSDEAHRKRLSHCKPADREAHRTSLPVPVPWASVVGRVRESNELRPTTQADVAELREALRKIALPQRPLTKPMLVIAGGRDSLVLPVWVKTAVSQSCALGGRIQFTEIASADHQTILWKAAPRVEHWIADRFAGIEAKSTCAQRAPSDK
ncbi:lipase family protein [Mycobacterium sp. NAZ190054]|uniref:lipase family protein n=1 Tax=Mycobacterium sp. NAZ190054 TaxID=1747766 RepID=UPI001E4C7AB4|nr:lipase family protein [Mycobacterium sp. NAZ190054]